MSPVSVIVITKNEGLHIEECLRSVAWCDDIVVVDAESTDDTVQKASVFTSSVFVRPWLGFAAAKQFAVQQTKNDWVLWLDADERVPEALAREIDGLVSRSPVEAAFAVARRAYFLGRWIRHSGWYPGYVPRLFHRQRASFNAAAVHEGLQTNGAVSVLRNDLLHYTDPDIYHYFSKLNRYTTLAADELHTKGQRGGLSDMLIRPVWQFIRMYILKWGFLDGIPGLLLALFSAGYVFTKYCKLIEYSLPNHPTEHV